MSPRSSAGDLPSPSESRPDSFPEIWALRAKAELADYGIVEPFWNIVSIQSFPEPRGNRASLVESFCRSIGASMVDPEAKVLGQVKFDGADDPW